MSQGRVVENSGIELYQNLAVEEVILRNLVQPTIMFWRNRSSVVVGRGQVVHEEVNLDYCHENGVILGRRITGGGAVYHDLGNMNTSIFLPRELLQQNDVLLSSSSLTRLFAESIKKTGFSHVDCDGCYDILYNGFKISGAAAYFSKDYILHHATLLIDTDLNKLEGSLVHHQEKRKKRNSKYRPTTNLRKLNICEWKQKIIELIGQEYDIHFNLDELNRKETHSADSLRSQVYTKKSWIIDGTRSNIIS